MKRPAQLLALALLAAGVAAHAQTTYGPVRAGEDLWEIAKHLYPGQGVSTDQIMLALLRANPQAFEYPCNANAPLEIGSVLSVPALADVEVLDRADAEREFARQLQEWKHHRQTGKPFVCPPVSEVAPTSSQAQAQATPPALAPEPAAPPKAEAPLAPATTTAAPPASPPATPPKPEAPASPAATTAPIPASPPATSPQGEAPAAPAATTTPPPATAPTAAAPAQAKAVGAPAAATAPAPASTPATQPKLEAPAAATAPTATPSEEPTAQAGAAWSRVWARITPYLWLGWFVIAAIVAVIAGVVVWKCRHESMTASTQPSQPTTPADDAAEGNAS